MSKENDAVRASISAYMADNKSVSMFDFDGTMADTETWHEKSFIHTFNAFGITGHTFVFEDYVGKPELQVFDEVAKKQGITLDFNKTKEIRISYFLERATAENLKPYVQIEELMQDKNATNIIVSNQRLDVIEHFLKTWNLSDRVQEVVSCAAVGTSKKNEIEKLSKDFQAQGKSVIHFEDSAAYIEASNKLNNKTVFVQHRFNKNKIDAKNVSWILDMSR